MVYPSRNMSRKQQNDINPSEEQKQDYTDGKFCWCGYPFDNDFFENDDDEDENFDVAPKRTTKIIKKETFSKRYCEGKTLADIENMYDEYKETHYTSMTNDEATK